jgi:hypothetical protein
LFGDSRRPAKKRLSSPCPGVSSSPPPPPQEKTIHNLPKNASPSRPPHHQCLTKGQTPWAAPIYESTARTSQRIRARANKRPRVSAIKTTLLKALLPSRGNNDQAFPTPNATRRVPAQWARTTRSPAPVRGPTYPSTPHPPP